MASRLDQALDEVIQDRRSERSGGGGGRRYNNMRNNNGDRTEFTRRRQVDSDGTIRKRLGPSDTIRSFVRTVNVKNDSRGSRNVNSQWSHDLFDDDRVSGSSSIISRLGGRESPKNNNKTQDISVENLHYDVTEKDLVELFSTVADVVKAKLVFDISGRSTGVGSVTYNSLEDAEKAIKKYNNIELDGQEMRIELKEYVPRQPRVRTGRFNNNRLDNSRGSRNDRGGNRNDRGGNRNDRAGGNHNRDSGNRDRRPRDSNRKDDRNKIALTAEDLDKEMDNYMKSNGTNEDTDMMLD